MMCRSSKVKVAIGLGLFALFISSPLCSAQDRDEDRDRDRDRDREMTRLEPGTVIPIRTNDSIDVERKDNRVYYGTVDQDVRGDNGRIAIPRGSNAELIVRVEADNDLILDLESVSINGQRYAIRTDPNRVESQRDYGIVGAIEGAINGGQVRGRAVRIPRDSVVTFRLERPLDMGVTDRGVKRDGYHYHDWYDRDHQ
ncbi:MAG TPA: hypothetical protein VNY30_06045 [Bryobacteraceae bacterium]|nr:hypothetical protein [Bryobacteraceae bacterium]